MNNNLPLFRGSYYIFVSADDYVWNGTNWSFSHWEAKHYETWTAVRSAQHQLQFNPNFKAKKSQIKAIFKP